MPEPCHLLLNQSVGRLFLELAEDISREVGPSRLVIGSRVQTASPLLEIWQAPAYDKRSMLRRTLSWIWFMLATMKEIARVRRVCH